MPIKLNLSEKCYIVALLGDIPKAARGRLFKLGRCPVHAGPALITEAYRFVESLKGSGIEVLKRRRRKRQPRPWGR